MKLKGRRIVGGKAEGEVIVSRKPPLSFLGGVDPETGIVTDAESDIRGQSIAGKILVFPRGKAPPLAPMLSMPSRRTTERRER